MSAIRVGNSTQGRHLGSGAIARRMAALTAGAFPACPCASSRSCAFNRAKSAGQIPVRIVVVLAAPLKESFHWVSMRPMEIVGLLPILAIVGEEKIGHAHPWTDHVDRWRAAVGRSRPQAFAGGRPMAGIGPMLLQSGDRASGSYPPVSSQPPRGPATAFSGAVCAPRITGAARAGGKGAARGEASLAVGRVAPDGRRRGRAGEGHMPFLVSLARLLWRSRHARQANER